MVIVHLYVKISQTGNNKETFSVFPSQAATCLITQGQGRTVKLLAEGHKPLTQNIKQGRCEYQLFM